MNTKLNAKQDASTAITTSNISSQSVNYATSSGSCTGNAATATKLASAKTLQTNLASTSAVGFDGSANKTIGVSGTLPLANGGTGATTAANARTNLGLGAAATYGVTTSATSGSTALITSGAVYSGLSGKANSSHTHSYLPLSGGTVSGNIDVTGAVQALVYYGADNTDVKISTASSNKNIVLLGAGIGCYNTGMTANIPIYASAFTVSSSKHVKENIIDMTDEEANKILDVNIISFDYKENFGGNKNNFGVIAEDVKDIIPTVVSIPNNYDESLFDESKGINQPIVSVDYSKFVPHLIKMVQIQQKQIDELKSLIK